MIITTYDSKHKFFERFNTDDGFYVRSGVFVNGKETEEDSFMRSYPGLIDVGIMGHCDHAKLCNVGCYQGGNANQKPNMTLENYKSIVDESKGKLFQIALGGHGDPNKHENFAEIIKYTRENNIVPNYTTSGFNLTKEEIELTKQYCGAVAVSWYRQNHTFDAIEAFINAGCTTNIHFVLSNKTIDEAIKILKYHVFVGNDGSYDYMYDFENVGLNAIVFLTHKPVGCGSQNDVLDVNDPRVKEFCELASKEHPFKVGFDSCFVPALVNFTTGLDTNSFEGCEGATFSGYISADMQFTPCSFDQNNQWSVNLDNYTIQQGWDSKKFDDFRFRIKNNCAGCENVTLCKSGCPIKREIILCGRAERRI